MKNKDNVVIITYVPPCFQCTVLFSFENAENDYFFSILSIFLKKSFIFGKRKKVFWLHKGQALELYQPLDKQATLKGR